MYLCKVLEPFYRGRQEGPDGDGKREQKEGPELWIGEPEHGRRLYIPWIGTAVQGELFPPTVRGRVGANLYWQRLGMAWPGCWDGDRIGKTGEEKHGHGKM